MMKADERKHLAFPLVRLKIPWFYWLMIPPFHLIRLALVSLSCVAYLMALPELSLKMADAIGGGSHDVSMIQHEGHQDIVFHHRDAKQAATCGHHTLEQESKPDHHHEDHVLHLTQEGAVNVSGVAQAPIPGMTVQAVKAVRPSRPANKGVPQRICDQPPAAPDGILRVVRSVVLVI